MSWTKLNGMTLLELLIVIVIISILASIAIPLYTNQMTKVRRTDGLVSVMDLATRMERYYAENHSFVGATVGSGGTVMTTNQSPEGYYILSLANLSDTTFTATATPNGIQATNDTTCAALSMNELGQKAISGTGTIAKCWH